MILQDSSKVDDSDIIDMSENESEEDGIEMASINEEEDEDEENHDILETRITVDDSDDSEFEVSSEEEEPPIKTRRPKNKTSNTIQ